MRNGASKARAWLASQAGTYGFEARKHLTEAEDLALSRRYLPRAKFAGFAGINWSPELGGQGLSPLHKVVFEEEEMPLRHADRLLRRLAGHACADHDEILRRHANG